MRFDRTFQKGQPSAATDANPAGKTSSSASSSAGRAWRWSANLSFLFPELPFLDRFAAAAAAGFEGIEYLFPYDWPAEALRAQLDAHGLTQVLFNLPPGDWAAGERGTACHPGREAVFAEGVEYALVFAKKLGCCRLHAMSGLQPAGVGQREMEASMIRNLRFAADRVGESGITLLIEPINSLLDMPGYWLDTLDKAEQVWAAVDRPNLKIQLDVYHRAVVAPGTEADALRSVGDRLGHVQIADAPGRHEPGTGAIDFAAVFASLDAQNYAGWVGCEYRPLAGKGAGFGWWPGRL